MTDGFHRSGGVPRPGRPGHPRPEPLGTFCLVLHTHLPWLAHGGSWPVGEEWLYQSWAGAYLPVVDLLRRLAEEGHRELITIGVTPVLAAQLDDPYCLRAFHHWLGDWRLRAEGLAARRDPGLRELAGAECTAASWALAEFEARWRHGGSPVLRELIDAGVVELLGGPATHPFLPLLDERVARFQLQVGLADAALRFGHRPAGLWAPECGYRPGLHRLVADAGVHRFVVDGPTLIAGAGHRAAATGDAWRLAGTDTLVFGRDLSVTYRVWSPRRGYPAGRHYRDFHTFDHPSGFRPARVTGTRVPPERKAAYRPGPARAQARADAADFVGVVRRRLAELRDERGRPGLVVAAYDTELFGHWWYEGPLFLETLLRALPTAGVRVSTLAGAVDDAVAGEVELAAGSWGRGKDWRVWAGPHAAELAGVSAEVQHRLAEVVAKTIGPVRREDLDQLAREALLVTSSDWVFCQATGAAADYARRRALGHADRFTRLADRVAAGRPADRLAGELRQIDGPFGHLDARGLLS